MEAEVEVVSDGAETLVVEVLVGVLGLVVEVDILRGGVLLIDLVR
jgi:hypothetical protein